MTGVPRGDALALTAALVAVDSRNPSLAADGPGEGQVAERLAEILRSWGLDVAWHEHTPGRVSVVARAGRADGGRSILLNGHLDTVGVEGMRHPPFTPTIHNGRLYGRGSADMKAGVAAMAAAAVRAHDAGAAGEIILAAVADEEWESLGTRALLADGLRADAAIVTEPTRLAIAPAHKGFAWAELTVRGRAAHGSRADVGVDAIAGAAKVLAALDDAARASHTHRSHPLLGHASWHAGTISGGIGLSTYPDRCTVSLERRTLPDEDGRRFAEEITAAIAAVCATTPALDATVTPGLIQQPNDLPVDHPLVRTLETACRDAGWPAAVEGLSCWTDAALFTAAGIPALCFGPGDIALAHAAEEWVPVDEIHRATDILTRAVHWWTGAA